MVSKPLDLTTEDVKNDLLEAQAAKLIEQYTIPPDAFTASQLAAKTGILKKTVMDNLQRQAADGELKKRMIGGTWWFFK
jgi:hypothetical protein